jgi:hypothetical protein
MLIPTILASSGKKFQHVVELESLTCINWDLLNEDVLKWVFTMHLYF